MTQPRLPAPHDLPVVVRSSDGRQFELVEQLGAEGGFGAAYLDRSGLAVKLFKNPEDHRMYGPGGIAELVERLARLPIRDLRIARPLGYVDGEWQGFAMELVDEMDTFRHLLPPGNRRESPKELQLRLKGLGRLYELCWSLADVMSDLRDRGLVFADLNPNNAMVSRDGADRAQAWLIDIDNLHYGRSHPLSYPGYAAPEVAAGRAPNTDVRTDAWSLAVLVFEALTQSHPFLGGDLVEEGDPEKERHAALEGNIPWIDDVDDDINRSSVGLPREVFLTKGLRKYFQQMFGPGRRDPDRRPSPGELARLLERARQIIVPCPGCAATVLGIARTCPWCDTALDFTSLAVTRQPFSKTELQALADSQPPGTESTGSDQAPPRTLPRYRTDYFHLGEGELVEPPARYLSYSASREPLLRFHRAGRVVAVDPLLADFEASLPVFVVDRGGKKELLTRPIEFRWDQVHLVVGDPDGPHTVVRSTG